MPAKTTDTREARWRKYLPGLMTTTKNGQSIPPKPEEVEFVIDMCRDLDLDPLLGEFVLFKGRPYITEVGLMKKAIASGELNGMDVDAVFADPDGRGDRWIATTTLYRKGCDQPFTFRADQKEYENPSSGVWQKNKRSMTEKCCTCKTIRHAFAVSLVSIEEMAVDEATGMTGEESQAAARAQDQTDRAEGAAASAAEGKAEAKEAAKAAAAEKITPDQHRQIGALYKQLGLPRNGDNGSEALFRRTFPADKHPHLAAKHEQFLTGSEAVGYIRSLWKTLAVQTAEQLQVPKKAANEALKAVVPNAKNVSEVLEEEWPRYIRALKWAGVRVQCERLKIEADADFVSRWLDATGRDDVTDEQLDAYVAELQGMQPAAETPVPEPAQSEPVAAADAEQAGLFADKAA